MTQKISKKSKFVHLKFNAIRHCKIYGEIFKPKKKFTKKCENCKYN